MMRQDASISNANRLKQLAALASVGASFFLTAAKLSAGVMSGSLALISEGAHNTVDIVVSATTFLAVRAADKPADAEHPFGHAKIEATRLLTADKVDEHAVDAQIEEAARTQAEMQKLRLGTALRVRALLTPEQRQKLEQRKDKHEGPKPAAGSPGQPPAATGAADEDDDDDDDDDADG